MGLSSSRFAARQEQCRQEEEGPTSKGEHASELCTVRSSSSGSNTDQIPLRELCSNSSNNFTKRGLLESLQKIKQEIPAFAEYQDSKVHQPPRILCRSRTYKVNAYSLTKLERERLGEAEGGQCSIEEVQARLKNYTGSVPQPSIVKADGLPFIERACRTSSEISDSTSWTNTIYSSSLDLSGRLSSCTVVTEGSPSCHGYSDCESTENTQYAQSVPTGPSHFADLRGVPTNRGEPTERENRRSSGRCVWDAVTWAASQRRLIDYCESMGHVSVPCNDRPAVLNRWFGAIAVPGEEREGRRPYRNRGLNLDERRHRFRSQVWALQRLSSSIEGVPDHIRPCTRRVQHDSVEQSHVATQTSEETDTRASISRIIMLAEALFQVLDEMHRQSIALSQSEGLTFGPLRAPDSIVESMPMKVFQEVDSSENIESQCHICLVDYEEGDYLRVLPCSHEYHMTCIDKWLKKVHRVCPLCRRDVCDLAVVEK